MEIYTNINKKYHCVKNVHIRIFFGPCLLVFGLKIRNRKSLYLETFHIVYKWAKVNEIRKNLNAVFKEVVFKNEIQTNLKTVNFSHVTYLSIRLEPVRANQNHPESTTAIQDSPKVTKKSPKATQEPARADQSRLITNRNIIQKSL